MTTYTVHFRTCRRGRSYSRTASAQRRDPLRGGAPGRVRPESAVRRAGPLRPLRGDRRRRAARVRRRSTIRLSDEDVAAGYALACQTVVEGDAWVTVPPQEAIERRLITHKAAARVEVPFDYDPRRHQSIQRYFLRLDPPDAGRSDRRLGAG